RDLTVTGVQTCALPIWGRLQAPRTVAATGASRREPAREDRAGGVLRPGRPPGRRCGDGGAGRAGRRAGRGEEDRGGVGAGWGGEIGRASCRERGGRGVG